MMTFVEYIEDVFVEHHIAMGLCVEESRDLFNDSNFDKVCKWLKKIGYDLDEYYLI